MEILIKWQEKRRKKLYNLLGKLPERDYPVKVIKRIEEEREKYILEKLILDLNGYELVPAYFVKPKNLKNKVPAIVFNHSHGGKYYLGKDEFIEGNSYMAKPPYAE
ncbi:MAG: alpha/beta hydrolase, partial [Candidatus Ratteibacteria bacterium]